MVKMSKMTVGEFTYMKERIEKVYNAYKRKVTEEHTIKNKRIDTVKDFLDLVAEGKISLRYDYQDSKFDGGHMSVWKIFNIPNDYLQPVIDCETVRDVMTPIHMEKERILNLMLIMDRKELKEAVESFCDKYTVDDRPKCHN